MKKLIYYFSGTGNSFRAAKRIAEMIGDVRMISMRNSPSEVPATDADVIGIVCPVYHWSVCAPIQRFLKALEVNPNAYVFAVTTPYAINGYAFETIDAILREKGAHLHFGRILYSIANLCIAYPPFPSEKHKIPKTERKLVRISKEIASQKVNEYPRASLLTRLLYPKVMPKFLPLQPVIDKGFYISDDCISCGICAKVCPTQNITQVNGRPEFNHHCCACMACVVWCPKKAVKYTLPEEQAAQFKTRLKGMMKLPEKRKRYHHPMVKWNDLAENERYFK